MDQERTGMTDMQCRVKAHLEDKAGDQAACNIGLSCLQDTVPDAAVQHSSSWYWRPRSDVQCSLRSNGQRVCQQRPQVTLTVLDLKSSGTLSDMTTSASNVPKKIHSAGKNLCEIAVMHKIPWLLFPAVTTSCWKIQTYFVFHFNWIHGIKIEHNKTPYF